METFRLLFKYVSSWRGMTLGLTFTMGIMLMSADTDGAAAFAATKAAGLASLYASYRLNGHWAGKGLIDEPGNDT